MNANEWKTETFSNRDGWIAVRVTHVPTGRAVDRARSEHLRSAVQAQRECVDELRPLVDAGGPASPAEGVGRAEFDALLARVEHLEQLLARVEAITD